MPYIDRSPSSKVMNAASESRKGVLPDLQELIQIDDLEPLRKNARSCSKL
jgi:hypothetical protein